MKYQITATIYTENPLPESEQLELRDTVLHSLKNSPHAQFVKIGMEEERSRSVSPTDEKHYIEGLKRKIGTDPSNY
mgnify:FL=1